ncbi:MAG: hypothetical protein HRF40_04460 [Nitrososphaera sp.]|jgi:hypothetical protein
MLSASNSQQKQQQQEDSEEEKEEEEEGVLDMMEPGPVYPYPYPGPIASPETILLSSSSSPLSARVIKVEENPAPSSAPGLVRPAESAARLNDMKKKKRRKKKN